MADDVDVAHSADAPVLERLPMRDENGEIRREFVEDISRAIRVADAASLRAIVAELHEADLGDLIAALEPEDRVSLVELTGADFDFSALNEVDDSVREILIRKCLQPGQNDHVRRRSKGTEVLRGDDSDHSGRFLSRLDPNRSDARVSMRASKERQVRQPGKLEVLDVLPRAGDELGIFQPFERLADVSLRVGVRSSWAGVRHLDSVDSPSAMALHTLSRSAKRV